MEPEKTELADETSLQPESAAQSTQARKPARKRTKTGCLTCRRRRIKCGEERPVCQNCIKSKRECEGYTQRVISRHPLSMLSNSSLFPRGPPGANQSRMPFDNPYLASPSQTLPAGQHHNPLLPLAPRPATLEGSVPGNYNATAERGDDFAPGVGNLRDNHMGDPTRSQLNGMVSPTGSELAVPASSHQPKRDPTLPINRSYTSEGFYEGQPFTAADQMNQVGRFSRIAPPLTYAIDRDGQRRYIDTIQTQNYAPPVQNPVVPPSHLVLAPASADDGGNGADGPYYATNREPTEAMQAPCNNIEDEDYDMEEDYDDDIEWDQELATDRSGSLQTILAVSRPDDRQPRSFSTYLNEPNLLTTYRPSPFASPLMDSKCARIFCHFVASTAPLLSIFERHPINPSLLFTGAPVPLSQQGLWTYTLPMKALEHQGLLHAVLAIASLHISRLQQTPATTSHKHYHFAIRRVARALDLPQRRKQTETFAATLLLGFYEVITAEHSKWNSHVAGAAQLLREIDFVRMTRTLRAQRANRNFKHRHSDQPDVWGNPSSEAVSDDDPFAEKEGSIDENFISTLVGRVVRYDDVLAVESEGNPQPNRVLTAKDIEDFRIQSDLHWWFCKQDIIRSMISGNPLLMPFDRWGQCPPRAGFGRLDAVYGTMDHLFLLMARICNFGAVDRDRKVKVMEANGGQYKPPPGLFQPPNTGNGSPTSAPNGESSVKVQHPSPHASPENEPPNLTSDQRYNEPTNRVSPPQGSIPQPASSDNPSSHTQPGSPESTKSNNLEAETAAARAEWSNISAAFETFGDALGPGFAPLPADSVQSITTPFGPAVQYRTHTIAFLMAFYYTGKIMVERLHPDMPPAAMVAAGIAAPRTAQYSQFIGKIAAGLYYPQHPIVPGGGLSPTLGAALSDITIGLFFAGVQYRDAAQRGWTISKLRDITRLTGWQSAAAVAAGCETAWIKAYEAGKGPPYQRTMDNHSSDSRISGKPAPDARDQEGRIIAPAVENDRRFITVDQAARVHWASGVLSLEGDFSKMNLSVDGVT
ncbi:hypothetical protein FQN54_002986 [Arachnomyces sp. PD_36]|nr:hypothetical protein FQN54_002986 [Arachnomyces sp. PD_36]